MIPGSTVKRDDRAFDNALAHWRSKMRGDATPLRYDIDEGFAANTLLLERDENGRALIRKSGKSFENLAHGLISGREFSALFVDYHRPKIDKQISDFFDAGVILDLGIGIGSDVYRIALLPIRADHGPNDFAFVISDMAADIDVGARKLTFTKADTSPIKFQSPARKLGFAEDKAGFAAAPKSNFTVVKGDGKRDETVVNSLRLVQTVKREP